MCITVKKYCNPKKMKSLRLVKKYKKIKKKNQLYSLLQGNYPNEKKIT